MSKMDNEVYDRVIANERAGNSMFRDEYKISPEAIAMVNRVFDYIESDPERWNQDTYGNDRSVTNCFMGIICRLDGLTPPGIYADYYLPQAMSVLGMNYMRHQDRANYIAMFMDVRDINDWRHPTLDEMRVRVSIALSHDFRKSENDSSKQN